MRRIGKGNKIVKNCIVWAMSAMIAVGSIAPAQVVRAEGTETQQVEQTDNTVNSYHQCDVHTDRVDGGGAPASTDSSFHDNEAQKNAQASTEIQTMTKQADAAADAAADAKQAVADAQQAVDDAKSAAGAAQTAAVTEQSAANTAEDEANKANTAVDGLNGKAAENIDNYNTNVTAANQAAADGAADLNNGVVINEKQTDGTTTPNVNVADVQGYAEDQAAAAEAAKATAEKELQAALDVPATDYNDPTVKQHVDNVKAAATEAQTAADNAAAVVTAADQELLDKITEYNASALEFGTDPYPYTAADGTVTYPGYPSTSTGENPTQVDIEANKKAAQDAKAKLAADKKAIEDTNMAAAATAVNAAADAKTAAETAKQTAVDAAATAATVVETMNKKINGDPAGTTPEAKAGDLKTATDNCALVSDHDVTPAQKALDASQADVTAKTEALTAAQNTEAEKKTAKDAATVARQKAEIEAKTNAEKAFSTKQGELKTALERASTAINRDDYDSGLAGTKAYLKAVATQKKNQAKAKIALDLFNLGEDKFVKKSIKENSKLNDAKSAEAKAANDLQTAQQNVVAQQQLFDTATATRNANQDTRNAAITTRDETVAAAETSYKDQKIDELYASINAALLDQSANVNQAEYDKAANDWANGFEWSQVGTAILNGVSADNIILSKAEIRYAMDHSTEYGNGSGGSFFDIIKKSILNIINTTPVAQLTVSPKLVDGNIDKAISAAETQMTSYNEELQVVRANAARLDVQAAATTAKTVKEEQSANQITVDDISAKIVAASSKIDTATTTYNTAKTKLDDLKASVNGKSISNVDLSALKAAIAAAQAKVDSAKDALKEAKAAAASAQSYADWGNSLLVAQNSKTFGQLDTDGSIAKTNNDKFDQGNENVVSRDSALFTSNLNTVEVPYSIYKEYVKQMYTLYSYEDRNKADYKDSEGNTVKGGKGKGISNENSGTMPTVYWVIKDGKLTGVRYLSTDANIPDGTYFVGYTFKAEGDGYHIDGTLYDYKNPVTPTPTPEPTTIVTTISNAPTALAAAPAVLGARRTPEATPVADTDKAVLGAKRGAATGDDSNATGWIALMICTMGAGAAVVLGRRKEQENAQ